MWQIILAIYVIGIPVSYLLFIKKFNNSSFEKFAFSFIWPLLLPLYLIHFLYNKLK